MAEEVSAEPKSRNHRAGHKRGKGNKKRRARATARAWGRELKRRRHESILLRTPMWGGISPFLYEGNNTCGGQQVMTETYDWYDDMPDPWNQYLEVRDGVNMANPTGTNGQKGVFATRDIPVSTYICPYLGSILRKKPADCEYAVELDRMTFVDAREILYDYAYVLIGKDHRVLPRRHICPPNYGRYINTMNASVTWQLNVLRERRNHYFNATLEADRSGTDNVWVYANRNIFKGEEILMDYGMGERHYPVE